MFLGTKNRPNEWARYSYLLKSPEWESKRVSGSKKESKIHGVLVSERIRRSQRESTSQGIRESESLHSLLHL